MHDLTAFQRDILYIAPSLEKPYGLAFKELLEEYYDESVNHGRLYPNLDQLVEKGLLEKDELDKRTNTYTLTNRARRELESASRLGRNARGYLSGVCYSPLGLV